MKLPAVTAALVALAFVASSLAQDSSAPSRPSGAHDKDPETQGRNAAPKLFRDLEKKWKVALAKCDACNGLRKVEVFDGQKRALRACSDCGGTGKAFAIEGRGFYLIRGTLDYVSSSTYGMCAVDMSKYEFAYRLLDGYVEWCEAIEQQEAVLAQKQNSSLRKRIEDWREQWCRCVREGVKPLEISGKRGSYGDSVFTLRAISVIYGKDDPVGRPVAFAGLVDEVLGPSESRVARVLIDRGNVPPPSAAGQQRVDTPSCFVEVPDGVRWVAGAHVTVIGRIIDAAGREEVLQADANAVLLRPTFGTK